MNTATLTSRSHTIEHRADAVGLVPLAVVICYPFLLDVFHAAVGPMGSDLSTWEITGATMILIAAFAVPFVCLLVANRSSACKPSMRRLAYLGVAAPTLYVFLGVVNYMAKSAYPDQLIWCVLWVAFAAWAWFGRSRPVTTAKPDVAPGRIAHGIVAAIIMVYVVFHLANHLFLLVGLDAHTAVMHLGETVYRAKSVEILLVFLMLFMCCSGGFLAWRWSAADSRQDFFRTFQVASGVFLLTYIVGHLDSVFVYARLFLGITTDWKFAVGAPTGMIHDAWNIRLLPHYALGVFFALAHPATGFRGILLKHGVRQNRVNVVWVTCIAGSAGVAAAIIIGMCSVTPI